MNQQQQKGKGYFCLAIIHLCVLEINILKHLSQHKKQKRKHNATNAVLGIPYNNLRRNKACCKENTWEIQECISLLNSGFIQAAYVMALTSSHCAEWLEMAKDLSFQVCPRDLNIFLHMRNCVCLCVWLVGVGWGWWVVVMRNSPFYDRTFVSLLY